jgi:hypothetical protein
MHPRPALVAHADWGSATQKRALASARLSDNARYQISTPRLVEEPERLLANLVAEAGPQGSVLVGFDFPIGLPLHYANLVGVQDFPEFLKGLGQGEWKAFYQVAASPEEINFHRPFYPRRAGASKQYHLLQALQATNMDELRRLCERAGLDKAGVKYRAACPLFWTLGGQQVGKAAILGWSQVIGPALRDPSVAPVLWPFHGELEELIQSSRTVIVETYPAEYYHHLDVRFSNHRTGEKSGKRVQSERVANAGRLLEWTEDNPVDLTPALKTMLLDGFGSSPNGDDQFDSVVGLFGMLNILFGNHPCRQPADEHIRKVEGWIFGK